MNATHFNAPLRRFVWKEYRMLRGFWIGVFCLGLLADFLFGVLSIANTDLALLRLNVALAAATLYAAGAAAILFSVEQDEQTYDFLRSLPATSGSALAGKIVTATLTSLALAAALSLVAWISSGHWTTEHDTQQVALGVFGPAIFEAVVWGTLFSLLLKRPLVAAIATLAVGALAAELAVTATASTSLGASDAAAYSTAIPFRLAIVIAVFALDIILGRQWLSPQRSRAADQRASRITARTGPQRTKSSSLTSPLAALRPRGMLAPLIWQTWRESRWRLLLPLAFTAAYFFLLIATGVLWPAFGDITSAAAVTLCLTPTLYGALAFSADHRRGQKRFLAEHAAAPRKVWLSRHIVWLGTLIALLVATLFAIEELGLFFLQRHIYDTLVQQRFTGNFGSPYSILAEIAQALGVARSTIAMSFWGALSAYAIGQICSMLLSSEILAAFLAILLATVLSAWIVALSLWQLSGALFLLPLFAGSMFATWLRAPDWIAGRTAWRHWLKPAAALATPAIFIAVILPFARLHQIDGLRTVLSTHTQGQETTSSNSTSFQNYNTDAVQAADMCGKALASFDAPIEHSPLDPWAGPEFAGGPGPPPGGIDEDKIPKDQVVAFYAAKRELADRIQAQREQALDLVVKASERPMCKFDFHVPPEEMLLANRTITFSGPSSTCFNMKSYFQMDSVQNALFMPEIIGPNAPVNVPFERLMAALRMSTHIMSDQPTVIVRQQFHKEQLIFRRICDWAHENASDPKKLRAAFHQLEKFHVWLYPPEAFMAEERLIRNVLTGKELPTLFSEKSVTENAKLAYVANDLPWERERALNANVSVTTHDANNAASLVNFVRTAKPNQFDPRVMQKLRPDYDFDSLSADYSQAATSYLFAQEYRIRVAMKELLCDFCDAEACRRAALIDIALMLYRHDHHRYPDTLTALQIVPETLRLDPYTSQSFFYMPSGLDENLTRYCYVQFDIRAQTPLLWSVGRNGAQLKNQEYVEQIHPDSSIVPRRDQRATPYYVLEPSQLWYSPATADLVFPFPRHDPNESDDSAHPEPDTN